MNHVSNYAAPSRILRLVERHQQIDRLITSTLPAPGSYPRKLTA